jgi:hypothetical protein
MELAAKEQNIVPSPDLEPVIPKQNDPRNEETWKRVIDSIAELCDKWGKTNLKQMTLFQEATLVWACLGEPDSYDTFGHFTERYLAPVSTSRLLLESDLIVNPITVDPLSRPWDHECYCALFTIAYPISQDKLETRREFEDRFTRSAFGTRLDRDEGSSTEPDEGEQIAARVFLSRFWLGEFCLTVSRGRQATLMFAAPELSFFLWKTAVTSKLLWDKPISFVNLIPIHDKLDAILEVIIKVARGSDANAQDKKALKLFVASANVSGLDEETLISILKPGDSNPK